MKVRIFAFLVVACATAAGTSLAAVAYAGTRPGTHASAARAHAKHKRHHAKAKAKAKAKGPAFVVKTAKVKKVGTVLENSSGRVLYVFAPDKAKKVACTSSCQAIWPPATVPAHTKLKAKGSVKQKLLGTMSNPVNHKRILTYDHWPLYTYVGDSAANEATGQKLNSTGGLWYVMRSNGKPLK